MSDLEENHNLIIGQVRHHQTGAFIVWFMLDDEGRVASIGAWQKEADAVKVVQEAIEAYHRLTDTLGNTAPELSRKVAWKHIRAFGDTMRSRSDAEVTVFSQVQLAEIIRNVAAFLKQQPIVPESPEGSLRVLQYTSQSIAGMEVPHLPLTHRNLTPRKGKRSHLAP